MLEGFDLVLDHFILFTHLFRYSSCSSDLCVKLIFAVVRRRRDPALRERDLHTNFDPVDLSSKLDLNSVGRLPVIVYHSLQ